MNILNVQVIPAMDFFFPFIDRPGVFQEDNARIHKAQTVV